MSKYRTHELNKAFFPFFFLSSFLFFFFFFLFLLTSFILGFEFERNKEITKVAYDSEKLFQFVSKLQSQFNALLNVSKLQSKTNFNPLINYCIVLLLSDSITLYNMLNEGISRLLTLFYKFEQEQAKKVIQIYQLYAKQSIFLSHFYEYGRTFIINLPRVDRVDTSVLLSMERYANGGNNFLYQELKIEEPRFKQYDENLFQNPKGKKQIVEESSSSDSGDNGDSFEKSIETYIKSNHFSGFTLSPPIIPSLYFGQDTTPAQQSSAVQSNQMPTIFNPDPIFNFSNSPLQSNQNGSPLFSLQQPQPNPFFKNNNNKHASSPTFHFENSPVETLQQQLKSPFAAYSTNQEALKPFQITSTITASTPSNKFQFPNEI